MLLRKSAVVLFFTQKTTHPAARARPALPRHIRGVCRPGRHGGGHQQRLAHVAPSVCREVQPQLTLVNDTTGSVRAAYRVPKTSSFDRDAPHSSSTAPAPCGWPSAGHATSSDTSRRPWRSSAEGCRRCTHSSITESVASIVDGTTSKPHSEPTRAWSSTSTWHRVSRGGRPPFPNRTVAIEECTSLVQSLAAFLPGGPRWRFRAARHTATPSCRDRSPISGVIGERREFDATSPRPWGFAPADPRLGHRSPSSACARCMRLVRHPLVTQGWCASAQPDGSAEPRRL